MLIVVHPAARSPVGRDTQGQLWDWTGVSGAHSRPSCSEESCRQGHTGSALGRTGSQVLIVVHPAARSPVGREHTAGQLWDWTGTLMDVDGVSKARRSFDRCSSGTLL